jgi:hypothetical protein
MDQTVGIHKNYSDSKRLIKIHPSKLVVIPDVVLEYTVSKLCILKVLDSSHDLLS